jgi:hypothetical protein
MGDMTIYNRRRRAIYLEAVEEKRVRDLAEAQAALARGEPSEEHMLTLWRVRAEEEARRQEEERKKEGRLRRLFKKVGIISMGKETDDTTAANSSTIEQANSGQSGHAGLGIVQAVEEKRREGEGPLERVQYPGGPLDQQAQDNANFLKDTAKGWTNWIKGR